VENKKPDDLGRRAFLWLENGVLPEAQTVMVPVNFLMVPMLERWNDQTRAGYGKSSLAE
jgi:hypothetical protein